MEALERGKGGNLGAELADTAKRLKKRELECQALWDTMKDLHDADQNIFDKAQMMAFMAKRSLDSKATRKLGI
jgi:hypothetical protein